MLDKGDYFELDKAVEWLTFSFFSEMSGVRFSTWKLPKLRETCGFPQSRLTNYMLAF